METTTRPVAGWYRDPSGRHEHRWWNGSEWTPHVITLGLRSLDYGDTPLGNRTDATLDAPAPVAEVERDAAAARRDWQWPTVVWITVLAGAGLLAVGAVLPWAEASAGSASFSSSGIDGNGGAALVAALAIALLCAVRRRPVLVAAAMIGIAAIAGAIGMHDALDISDKADRLMQRAPAVSAGVGVGIWVTLAGAAVAVIGGVLALVVAARRT